MAKKFMQKFEMEGKEILFRYPEPKDSSEMLKLVNSLFKERAMIGVNEKPTIKKVKESLNKRLNGIRNKEVVYLIVEADGNLKGRAWISRFENPCQNHIGNLVIHLEKGIRGRGIGDRLLKAIIREARRVLKIKIISLEVTADNQKAIKLYKKNGFTENGSIKKGINYYGKLVDEIMMVKYF